jgi:hypothetical protein
MKNKILKWWNREWSNWTFEIENRVYNTGESTRPIECYEVYKRTSNDGLVEFKKVKKF